MVLYCNLGLGRDPSLDIALWGATTARESLDNMGRRKHCRVLLGDRIVTPRQGGSDYVLFSAWHTLHGLKGVVARQPANVGGS